MAQKTLEEQKTELTEKIDRKLAAREKLNGEIRALSDRRAETEKKIGQRDVEMLQATLGEASLYTPAEIAKAVKSGDWSGILAKAANADAAGGPPDTGGLAPENAQGRV
jgi:hypothetical protein